MGKHSRKNHRPKKGDCYRQASLYIMNLAPDTDAVLVHGQAEMPGGFYLEGSGHAWAIDGAVVIDTWYGVTPLAEFYKRVVREDDRYTRAETLAENVKHKHWGPWVSWTGCFCRERAS